ncbi:hypothetical protein JCM8547_007452 [Rhodosporidiobolus lusitaniae]
MTSNSDEDLAACAIRPPRSIARRAAKRASLFFCSNEHQKLVWFAHKRVCGEDAKPFRFPSLTAAEAARAKQYLLTSVKTLEGQACIAEGLMQTVECSLSRCPRRRRLESRRSPRPRRPGNRHFPLEEPWYIESQHMMMLYSAYTYLHNEENRLHGQPGKIRRGHTEKGHELDLYVNVGLTRLMKIVYELAEKESRVDKDAILEMLLLGSTRNYCSTTNPDWAEKFVKSCSTSRNVGWNRIEVQSLEERQGLEYAQAKEFLFTPMVDVTGTSFTVAFRLQDCVGGGPFWAAPRTLESLKVGKTPPFPALTTLEALCLVRSILQNHLRLRKGRLIILTDFTLEMMNPLWEVSHTALSFSSLVGFTKAEPYFPLEEE